MRGVISVVIQLIKGLLCRRPMGKEEKEKGKKEKKKKRKRKLSNLHSSVKS